MPVEYSDSIFGFCRGHVVVWDEERDIYVYEDTRDPAEDWGGEIRQCIKCNLYPTVEGYDACLGYIEGATSACCGHGVEPPYSVPPGLVDNGKES